MEPIRTITFRATRDGLTPNSPQYAGVQGEHNATQVIFQLDSGLTILGGKYRIEYVDSTGQQDTTDFLTPSSGAVSSLLPKEWTSNGGIAEIRLVIASKDASTQATQTMITLAGKLYYADKYGCNRTDCIQKGLSELIEEAHDATADAAAAAETANTAATGALAATADAAAATQAANTAAAGANAAAQDASHFYTLAQGQAELATAQAGIAASQAEAALTYSETAAAEAGKAAAGAAGAQTAQAAAEAARNTAQAASDEANGLAEQVAADKAAVAADKTAASAANTSAEAALASAVEQAERAEAEADRAASIDAYTKGASDARYLRAALTEQPMADGTVTLTDADDGALASLRIDGTTAETGSGEKGPENPYTLSGAEPSKVQVCGKNLLDLSMVSGTNIQQIYGGVRLTGYSCTSNITPELFSSIAGLQAGDTITISRTTKIISGTVAPGLATGRIAFVSKTGGLNLTLISENADEATVTIPDDFDSGHYNPLSFYGIAGGIVDMKEIQLEQGAAATEYEPYQGVTVNLPTLAPLYSVGDVCDEYDAVSGVETRRIGVKVLDGTETYATGTTVNNARFFSTDLSPAALTDDTGGTINLYCTHFGASREASIDRVYIASYGRGIVFIPLSLDFSTVDEWVAWLAAQAAAGTPVTVLYELDEPVVTQHDPLTLPTHRDNTTVLLNAPANGLLRYPLSAAIQWDAKEDKTAALRRYAPALTGQASGASVTVSDAAAGFGMQRAAATGVTAETGTGDKAPGNPYTLSGAEPSKVRVCGKNLLGFEEYTYSTGVSKRTYSGNKIDITNIHTANVALSAIATAGDLTHLRVNHFMPGTYTFSAVCTSADRFNTITITFVGDNGTTKSITSGRTVEFTSSFKITGISGNSTNVAAGKSISIELQIEAGLAATGIEPYYEVDYPVPELAPLYSVGDVRDEFDAVSGVETRRIGVNALDGTESWREITKPGYANYTYLLTPSDKAIGYQTSLCSHFINENNAFLMDVGEPGLYTDAGALRYMYFVSSLATIDEWKAWLAAQAAAGTPVTIVYVLDEPVTIQHDPQDIAQPGLAMTVTADGGAGADIRYIRDLNAALLDQIEYATALEARIAQLEILVNPQS